MKAKKSKNSMAIAVYFGIAVAMIIMVSLIFKGVDLLRQSKFDSNHRLNVAVVSQNSSQIISVSPKDGTIFRLNIKGHISESNLKNLSVPIDAFIDVDKNPDISILSPKSEFSKFLFNGDIKSNLSFIDFLRLSIFSTGISQENIEEREVEAGDTSKISDISSNFFKDPVIVDEKVNIQITNTTDISGLGNKLAKYITNLGGVVVLVNTSSDKAGKSKIISETETETVKRLSKTLGIPYEKGKGSPLADVIIILGDDKKESLY